MADYDQIIENSELYKDSIMFSLFFPLITNKGTGKDNGTITAALYAKPISPC